MSDPRLSDYFCGRDAAIAEAIDLLHRDGKHLLVFYGPPGIGKQAVIDIVSKTLLAQPSTIVSQSHAPIFTIHDVPRLLRSWQQGMPPNTRMRSFDREAEKWKGVFDGPFPARDQRVTDAIVGGAAQFAGPAAGAAVGLISGPLAAPVGGLVGAAVGAAIEVKDARRRPQSSPMPDVQNAVRALIRAFAEDASHFAWDQLVLVGGLAQPDTDAIEALAEFVEACPDRVAVVVPALMSWPFRHQRWPTHVRSLIELSPMSHSGATDLANRYSIVAGTELPLDLRDRIVANSRGLPLMIVYAIDSVGDLPGLPPEIALANSFDKFVSQTLGSRSEEDNSNLATMTMVRTFDRRLLGEMGISNTDAQWQELVERRGYLEQKDAGTFAIHDGLRGIFAAYFLAGDPRGWRERRRQIAHRFDELAERATTTADVERYATESIYHWFASDPVGEAHRVIARWEFLAGHRLPDKLARLIRDVQTWAATEKLTAWLQYYGARGDQLGGMRFDAVEEEYRRLLGRDDVRDKLRAYIYCDLAQILARPHWLRIAGGRRRAEDAIGAAEDAVEGGAEWEPDPKLAQCWTHAARVHDHWCEWDQAIAKLVRQENVADRHGWSDVAVHARVNRAERLALAGRFDESMALDSATQPVSDTIEALATGAVMRGLWVYGFVGRLADGAMLADSKLAYARANLGKDAVAFYCRETGYLRGLRGERGSSEALFRESEGLYRSDALKGSYKHGLGMTLGFWTEVALCNGWADYCPETALDDAHGIKVELEDAAGLPETLALMAYRKLVAGVLTDALSLYNDAYRAALAARRPYFRLAARVGIARTMFAGSDGQPSGLPELLAECKRFGFHGLAAVAALIAAWIADDYRETAPLLMEAIVEALTSSTPMARSVVCGDVWGLGDLAIFPRADHPEHHHAISVLRQLWDNRPEDVKALERRRRARNDHVLCADFSIDSKMSVLG